LTQPVYHLAEPADWAASIEEYAPASFAEEGFIHCSTEGQLATVAQRRYRDHNDLILLAIDAEALGDTVVYEDLYDSGEEFPHIYAPLPTSAVLTTSPYLSHLEEGLWLETRADSRWMDRMLHPDFMEVGRSGRTYDRQQAIDTTDYPYQVDLPLQDLEMDLIDEDVALVMYVSNEHQDGESSPAHRTSVWVNTNDGWRLRFHQGTPISQGA
jgi:glutathione S-transferase